jgi:alkylation response protein AidB-like acyl-CoA dehydrogenase
MGVLSMLVAESDGGMGASMVDAALVFVELGRAAVPGPVIEHMVAAPILARVGASEAIAIATVQLDDPYVAHAHVADAIVVADGIRRGFSVADADGIDGGRRIATVEGGTTTPAPIDATVLADQLAVASAAVLIGLSEWMIAAAAEYAHHRQQFGKPIGSFQAVKHLLADALLQVEFAKAPTFRAAWSVAEGEPTASRDASMAKALANEAAYRTTRSTMQVHGGIGYTWEADLQLWMKKAWALHRAYGDTTYHRRRVSDAVLGGRNAP